MICDVHGHVLRLSYSLPVLYSSCNSFFMRDVMHGHVLRSSYSLPVLYSSCNSFFIRDVMHGHVLRSSYSLPVLYSSCNSFFMRDVHVEFGLINVHLFDILLAFSSRKVGDFFLSGE